MWGRTADRRIETPRLTLRPPRMDDASALAGTIGNYDVVRWLGSVPFPYGVEDAERFIAGLDRSKERHWLIFEDDALVGGIGISGELGFWLARTAWGRGIATEAADAVIDLHFRDRKAEALVSGHFVSNERSARVLDKLGFRDDGVTTIDARVLGQRVESRRVVLTRQDWLARRHYFLRARGLVLRNLRPSDWRGVRRLLATEGAAPSKARGAALDRGPGLSRAARFFGGPVQPAGAVHRHRRPAPRPGGHSGPGRATASGQAGPGPDHRRGRGLPGGHAAPVRGD